MKRNVVKPILFLTTIILALLVGISVKGTSISNKDDLLSLNIEALSDGEIYEIHFVKITQTTVIYTYDITYIEQDGELVPVSVIVSSETETIEVCEITINGPLESCDE